MRLIRINFWLSFIVLWLFDILSVFQGQKPTHPLETLKFEILNYLPFLLPLMAYNFTNLKHMEVSGQLLHRFRQVKRNWPNQWKQMFFPVIMDIMCPISLETLTLTDLDYSPKIHQTDNELAALKKVCVKPYENMEIQVKSLRKLFPVNSQVCIDFIIYNSKKVYVTLHHINIKIKWCFLFLFT